MKRFYVLITALLLVLTIHAQSPDKFHYQAVIRNTDGSIRTNQSVNILIGILQGSITGPSQYVETFAASTTSLGLVNLVIGNGTIVSGSLSSIDWSAGPYFLQIWVDGAVMGTSQLLSVPFSKYAEKAGNVISGKNKGEMQYWNGSSWALIPAGKAGQLLQFSASNTPYWSDISSIINPPGQLDDGMYISGPATSLATLDTKGKMDAGLNEVTYSLRPGMFVKFMALETGKTFTITEVAGATKTVYGAGTLATLNLGGRNDQVRSAVLEGNYAANSTFSVPVSGLYQIVLDRVLGKVAIIKVDYWAIIGSATAARWSDSQMPLAGTFNSDSMTFRATGIVLRAGDFKFRYSGGWKLGIDDTTLTATVKVNTNFGGSVTAPVPGGSNITLDTLVNPVGIYTITAKWTNAEGMSFKLTRTGNAPPIPEFPTTLYLIGDAVGGWDWAKVDLPMIPVSSHENAFWKIVYFHGPTATTGFRIAPEKAWDHIFGTESGATGGIKDFKKGTASNIPVPADSGYYMVYVDLAKDSISIAPAKVYLTGDPSGGYPTAIKPGDLFTVDNINSVLTLTETMAAGYLRLYANHKWMAVSDWWQTEFMILSNVIEFRGTGNDQTRVPVTAGSHTITLNFKSLAGSVAK